MEACALFVPNSVVGKVVVLDAVVLGVAYAVVLLACLYKSLAVATVHERLARPANDGHL